MRVLIDATFFAGPEAEDLAFLHLFALVCDGRHLLLTAPTFGPDGPPQVLDWLESLPEACCRQARQALEQGVSTASGLAADAVGIRLVAGTGSDWAAGQLCLPDVLRLLQTPLGVMVENRRADWRFLLALAPPSQRERLRHALDHGWLEILHAGGLGEMKAWLEELLEYRFTSVSNAVRLLRLWVMFDRDADHADRRQPSRESVAMKTFCESAPAQPWPLGHYRLGRRAIENYLPAAALHQWQSERSGAEGVRRRKVVSALCELRKKKPEAAHQYNMKRGLLGDLSKASRDDVIKHDRHLRDDDLDDLFKGLSDEDRAALTPGFGKDIAGYLQHIGDPDFRHEFERHLASGERDRETILNALLARL
jgi:hypothetical protein